MILNNTCKVDNCVFDAQYVHYNELLKRKVFSISTVYIDNKNRISL
jgi:hypothetical protein